MYKVFFNDRGIVIDTKPNITLNADTGFVQNLARPEEVKSWFLRFAGSNEQHAVIEVDSPDIFFESAFKPAFKKVKAAGGVVLRDNKILFIYRNGKWDLPKGKIDKGETTSDAACREVEEECGISGFRIVKSLPSTFHIYESPYSDSKGILILKETFWYEMSYAGTADGIPETGENITALRWFAKSELPEVMENTYENLKQIITLYQS